MFCTNGLSHPSNAPKRLSAHRAQISPNPTLGRSRPGKYVSAESLWPPEYAYPDAKRFYAEYRANALHKPEYPLLELVSGSCQLELERAVFRSQPMRTVVITASAGRDELRRGGAASPGFVEVHALDSSGGSIAPQAILQLLHSQFG